ncbi:MAG: hypothetical protein KatS3mg038_0442 [Candidatus Kapaibacterium sp.]|nr:MAG: hypothetical protein KatS3mg038_0442 [Candidatus Kapabacteria bacterium]
MIADGRDMKGHTTIVGVGELEQRKATFIGTQEHGALARPAPLIIVDDKNGVVDVKHGVHAVADGVPADRHEAAAVGAANDLGGTLGCGAAAAFTKFES